MPNVIRLRDPMWVKVGGFSITFYSWPGCGGGIDLRLPGMRQTLTIIGFKCRGRFNVWLSPDATPTRATWMLREYRDA